MNTTNQTNEKAPTTDSTDRLAALYRLGADTIRALEEIPNPKADRARAAGHVEGSPVTQPESDTDTECNPGKGTSDDDGAVWTDGGEILHGEFSPAERKFVEILVSASNDAMDDGLTTYRTAMILRATADVVDKDEPTPIYERFRRALGNPGSYLPADVVGGER